MILNVYNLMNANSLQQWSLIFIRGQVDMHTAPVSSSSNSTCYANKSSLKHSNISDVKQATDSISSNGEALLVPIMQTYTIKDFQIIDNSNTEKAEEHIEITHRVLSGKVESMVAKLNEKAREEFDASLVMRVEYRKSDSLLIFPFAAINGKIPFNATDAFEVMFNYGIENKFIGTVKEVLLESVSAIDNVSLVENLERIRSNNNLSDREKIALMELELFSGPHAGKSVLRRLNRVGYEPIRNSLEIDLRKKIVPYADIKFKVKSSGAHLNCLTSIAQ